MASGFRVNGTNTITTANGNIGIGTLTPTSNIHIVSASLTNAALRIAASEAINVAGNVWVSGALTVTGNLNFSGGLFVGANTVWHSGNDGVGSGLDADLLDGANSNFYTNSTNQILGTLPSARLVGPYTGITELGDLSNLNVTGNVVINASDASNAALRVTQTGAGPVAIFEDSTSPDTTPITITSTGLLIRGLYNSINSEGIQNFGTGVSGGKILSVTCDNAAAVEGGLVIARNRGNTTHQTLIQAGDDIGSIQFKANDGFTQLTVGSITVSANGAIAQDSIPTTLIIKTRNYAGVNEDRFVISSNGHVGIHNSNPRANLDVAGTMIVSGNATVSNISSNVATVTNIRTAAVNGAAPGGTKNILHNPFGLVRQRTDKITGGTGQIGLFDRWFSLAGIQNNAVTFVALDEQGGFPAMMRTRTTATGKKLALGQIVPGVDSVFMRGKPVSLTAYVARGSSANIVCAILEWTGPRDQVNRNVVTDWTQTDPQTFIDTTNITVLATNNMPVTSQTVTKFTASGIVNANCNNLIVFAWTNSNEVGTTGHLDMVAQLTHSETPETTFEFRPYHVELDICKRHFERLGGTTANANVAFGTGLADTTTLAYFPISFVEKRTANINVSIATGATPNSWFIRAAGANVTLRGLDVIDKTTKSAVVVIESASSMTAGQAVILKANNTQHAYIDFDAEI